MTDNRNKQLILANSILKSKKVTRAFCSIGSNIFFEFGEESFIWISLSSWRLTKDSHLVTGSGDSHQKICVEIEELKGKKFLKTKILSPYWEVEFEFGGGYKLTTFFDWAEEEQWTICLPHDGGLEIDCSTEEVRKELAKTAPIRECPPPYEDWDFSEENHIVETTLVSQNRRITIELSNDLTVNLERCTWRLSKNGSYISGCSDEEMANYKPELGEKALSKSEPEDCDPFGAADNCRDLFKKIKGSKLARITVNNRFMDMVIKFENGYEIETFTSCVAERYWILRRGRYCYEGIVSLES